MKKALAILLCLVMVFSFAACGNDNDKPDDGANTPATGAPEGGDTGDQGGSGDDNGTASAAGKIKVGVILIGDETEGYTLAHINGINAAKEKLGMTDDQIVWFYTIGEDSTCYDTAVELVENYDCNLVISNSYGHQNFVAQAAERYPDVAFVSATGDFAAICGLDNFSNAFTDIYESRYVSGVVAGMKLQQLIDEGKLTDANYDADGNIKIGYVGAFNYSEVVSGYTAFYLGIRSIVENVAMEVTYTSSWFNVDAEAAAAEQLAADGCVIVGQHADSTGAPSACEQLQQNGTVVYSVGYNVDMLDVAPNAALTSATNNWERFYEYAFSTIINGEKLETNWAKGYNDDAVGITALGASCAPGTAEKVAEVEEAIRNGTLHVFDTSTFTVSQDQGFCTVTTDADGHVTSCLEDMSFYDYTNGPTLVYEGETVEAITDGYFAESTFRSAPYFNIRIDGITELN